MKYEFIETLPDVMMGKPVFVGTRITVELILEKLGANESIEQIIEDYPKLTRPAIQEALRFAADVMHTDFIYLVNEKTA